MLTIVALMIVIAVIVFVHELGHFISARWAGARVDVFSIGFGKPIVKWHDKKGTEWRIAWLPFGGFVSIYGQDDMFNRQKYNDLSAKEKKGHYLSLPAWKQAIVIAAGVVMNIVTAWVIYTGLFTGTNIVQLPVIGSTAQALLKTGDVIMQVDGKPVHSWDQMILAKEMNSGKTNDVIVLRGEKLVQLKLPTGTWGVKSNPEKTETTHRNIFSAIGRAGQELGIQSKMMFVMLKQMVMGERSAKQLGGLISIAEISGKALHAGFVAMVSLIALLSVNLAVINLFPLPVLDGGYLLILAIEAVIRRKIQGKGIDWIMRVGLWLLISLMAFALSNDIIRIIHT